MKREKFLQKKITVSNVASLQHGKQVVIRVGIMKFGSNENVGFGVTTSTQMKN